MSDFWLNIVYIVDMVRIFTSPYQNKHGKFVYNKKQIAVRYLRTWLLFDIYAFYPLGFLRYISKWEEGSSTDNM